MVTGASCKLRCDLSKIPKEIQQRFSLEVRCLVHSSLHCIFLTVSPSNQLNCSHLIKYFCKHQWTGCKDSTSDSYSTKSKEQGQSLLSSLIFLIIIMLILCLSDTSMFETVSLLSCVIDKYVSYSSFLVFRENFTDI